MSWADLEAQRPELAAFGAARLDGKVAYLATARADGGPRVHPVTPIVGRGRMFVFMEPTSPKGRDLRRDPRYALHCAVGDSSGAGGEFHVAGRAALVEDPAVRALAVELCSYAPAERYILFELGVDRAASTVYAEGGTAHQRWQREG